MICIDDLGAVKKSKARSVFKQSLILANVVERNVSLIASMGSDIAIDIIIIVKEIRVDIGKKMV